MPVHGPFGLGDLFVDPAQRAPRPVVAVLVMDDPVWDPAGLLRRRGWPGLGQYQPIGNSLVGCLSRHSRTTSGRYGMRAPRMNDNPALAGPPGWLQKSSRHRRPP